MLIPSFPGVTAGEDTGDTQPARRREKESGGDEIKVALSPSYNKKELKKKKKISPRRSDTNKRAHAHPQRDKNIIIHRFLIGVRDQASHLKQQQQQTA